MRNEPQSFWRRIAGTAVLTIALLPALGTATASSLIFATGPATVGGSAVNAQAQFEFDPTNHRITLTLLNLQANPSDVTQLIGSVRFTLNNGGTSPSASLSGADISTFDVDSNGNPVTDTKANTWGLTSLGGTNFAFCTVCASGGNNELVIGGPNSSLAYSSANGSIAGNNAHNPFILGSNASYLTGALHGLDSSPSWVFSVPTMTVNTTVSNVIFGFGTGTNYGTNTTEVYTGEYVAPEPGPLYSMLGGVGLIFVGLWRRRARQQ